MTIQELKETVPGSQKFEELRSLAAVGNQAAATSFAHACFWNTLKKNKLISDRNKDLLFEEIVNAKILEVSVV